MSKKILIFSLTYHPFIGGAEVAIKEITDRISETDISFDMITLRFNSELPKVERFGNVTIHRIGFTKKGADIGDGVKFPLFLNKYLFPILALVKAVLLHRKNKYDTTWCMLANYATVGALFFKWLNPQTPYILTLQDGSSADQIKARTGVLFPLLKRGFINADMIQVISTFLVGVARDIGYEGKVEVVPNAVDTAHFSQVYSDDELSKLKSDLKLENDKKYLITTTRLVLTRGVEDIIGALPHLSENVHFLVLGTGPDEDALRKVAKENNVTERVHFVGHVDHSELPKYLRVADIFVRPSTIEGFGNSFVEAMAAEIPVVATPVGGIPDFLFDPEKSPNKPSTGLFCNVRDSESIAVQVKRIFDDENLASELVGNASKLAKEKYDWNLIAKDMRQKVFGEILK